MLVLCLHPSVLQMSNDLSKRIADTNGISLTSIVVRARCHCRVPFLLWAVACSLQHVLHSAREAVAVVLSTMSTLGGEILSRYSVQFLVRYCTTALGPCSGEADVAVQVTWLLWAGPLKHYRYGLGTGLPSCDPNTWYLLPHRQTYPTLYFCL